jgi:DUF4097 and DUF4098 domain-containing protein YvlB
MSTARLSLTMNTMKLSKRASLREAPSARADRLAVWILLALGLLLMLVSVGKAEQPSATRVQKFNGNVAAGQTIRVENISGDIVASPGREFSAVVTLTVSAATRQKADEILKKAEIVGNHDDDGWNLETIWPGRRSGGRGNRHGSPCDQCRISARYEIVVPPGVGAQLQTVNGDVRLRDVDGELNLETVNGSIEVRGARRSLSAQTVNGKIDAVAQALPGDTEISLQTVNGGVTLTLPADARFELEASTMNGRIASTFPLPPRASGGEVWAREARSSKSGAKTPKPEKGAKAATVVIEDEDGETRLVELSELDEELSESMKNVEISIEQGLREGESGLREAERQLRHIRVPDPHREYSGSIGKNGAQIHLETLNGAVLLLAAGTRETDAKPLVSERSSFVVTVPRVRVHVAPVVAPSAPIAPLPPRIAPAVPPAAPVAPLPPDLEGEIVRGNIAGDFLSTSTEASYRIGNISGRARILTHSGELRVGNVGAGAELKTFGGDIVVGAVTGDLKASTMAGDIRSGAVTGSALADTAGGDIVIERIGGNLDAKTAGGDIVVSRVGGAVRAVTSGGDVRIGVSSNDIKGGVTIHNSGGDVTLTLPADCKADLELLVSGADEQEQAIRSEFPNLAISKRPGSQRATLSLNGGGEKVVVRTSSGTIRLKKGTGA